MTSHQSEVGLNKWELDTPALLLDLAAMERNLAAMAGYFENASARLRPHVKLHKATPALAYRQLQAGQAVGLTCAKVAEAETLAAAGIGDILIANEVVGAQKIRRLVNLAAYANVMVAVDDAGNVDELSQAAQARGVTLRALVEVDIGHKRCGVAPFEPTVALCRRVATAPGLRFMGLMGYDGHCTVHVSAEERPAASLAANQLLVQVRRYVEQAGLAVQIVSASGTFTYRYAMNLPGITEIQAGSYLLMDTAYRSFGVTEFECTLSVVATVISRRQLSDGIELAVLDVGRKGMGCHYGLPNVREPAGATVYSMSQEHARVRLEGAARDLKVGDKVELWVADANETINLYDCFHALRAGTVEAVWDVAGRGQMT